MAALSGGLLCLTALGSQTSQIESCPLEFQGVSRPFLIHRSTKQVSGLLPVVIMLHGGGSNAQSAMRDYGWVEKSDAEGFLLIAPEALARTPDQPADPKKNPRLWNTGYLKPTMVSAGEVDDVGYLSAVIKQLIRAEHAQPKRIYVSGFSGGASMALRLGARYSDHIAAVGAVAGHLWDRPRFLKRAIPVVMIFGDDDPGIPVSGGQTGDAPAGAPLNPPLRVVLSEWIKREGCRPPLELQPGERIQLFSGQYCRASSHIDLYVFQKLGHEWPSTAQGFSKNATDLLWQFFTEYSLPGA